MMLSTAKKQTKWDNKFITVLFTYAYLSLAQTYERNGTDLDAIVLHK